jgi:hypothetical protein
MELREARLYRQYLHQTISPVPSRSCALFTDLVLLFPHLCLGLSIHRNMTQYIHRTMDPEESGCHYPDIMACTGKRGLSPSPSFLDLMSARHRLHCLSSFSTRYNSSIQNFRSRLRPQNRYHCQINNTDTTTSIPSIPSNRAPSSTCSPTSTT